MLGRVVIQRTKFVFGIDLYNVHPDLGVSTIQL